MSNLPQTLHSIKFYNRGTPHNPKWWMQKDYCDRNGQEHTENRKIDPDSAVLLEYVYLDDLNSPIPKRECIED